MNRGKVELTSFKKDKDSQFFEYSVEQNNGSTCVAQYLEISSCDGLFKPAWKADIKFNEFPPQETPVKAALKMADWLERLASAIRSGEYLSLPESEFKDLGN